MAMADRQDSRLGEYRGKRRFRKTPEPSGKVANRQQKLLFVVQKHAARRLHYDFRLEFGGVLLSWAVPKGPSLDPAVKRLAVHVEDHPREYADFEGTIPAGEYGAGTVIVWDRGRWKPESAPEQGYRKGHLKFRLFGKKLKGRWALIRARGEGGEENRNWFLIKHKDEESNGRDLLEEEPRSVKSGRTLQETAAGAKPRSIRSDEVALRNAGRLPGATPAKRPNLLHPQRAAPSSRLPTSGDWLYEVKFDGYRILAFLGTDGCRLVSRNGKDWSERFPHLCRALRHKGRKEAIIDGEVVYLRPDGTSDFQALQNAIRTRSDAESLVYFVFDLPYYNGYDLTRTPLVERKSFLQRFLAAGETAPGVHFSEHVRGMGHDFLRFACESRLEGILCKRADGPYRQGSSPDWLKIKCTNRQEFLVGGFTRPGGSRYGFGALLLGLYDDSGRLRYRGRVGTGFDRESLSDLVKRMDSLVREDSPFVDPPVGLGRTARWIEPELIVEVEFKEWTRDGLLRQPSYLGVREDKDPREITMEPPAQVDLRASRQGAAVPGRERTRHNGAKESFSGVRITHPDRIVYPGQGITKRELADYYERISDWMLPHVAGRPLAIVRCPKGQRGHCFFQKHAADTLPEEIRSVAVKENGEMREYIMIDSVKGLISLVQFGTLEFHPWGSRADKLETPDRVIFDLDPSEGIPWKAIVEAAFRLRSILEALGVRSFARTTGGKGLHVVVPLLRRSGWDEIRSVAAATADYLVGRHPSRYVRTMTRSARKGKIFIDHFRNRRGATAVAAYSTRARVGAPVAAPVSWEQLSEGVGPGAFNIRTVPDHLERLKQDPWKEFFAIRQAFRRDAQESLRSRS